ncbi:hydrogenase formation protein HypD [uncultured Desulfovibrio sp.]|uniref:hydrogenase formation protein HypD n=1 Tax=uncultured Desulfovibrio sp. TaxID=167968 RepID=UPI0026181DB1|nr:hydrogenase formation protein HypD [uncultured Desulfovibrio sp.]
MSQNPFAGFADPDLCRRLLARLEQALAGIPGGRMRFMEVCGTHTVAIFRSGLRSLLPAGVEHLSGPGCPVCVTHDAEIAAFLDMAGRDNVILATFGDLLRVPGPGGRTLKHAQAQGARIEIVYSPLDALTLAAANPSATVVFLAIGFETTAPTVAATLMLADQRKLDNFCIFSLHKLVPPALRALLDDARSDTAGPYGIDAFLLPGHVSTILGLEPYAFLSRDYRVPAVVGGFEPADILLALCIMAEQLRDAAPAVVNAYPRAVGDNGNPRARALLEEYFTPADALWRGIGRIPLSGLALRPAYAHRDAALRLNVSLPEVPPLPGCRCGDVLRGRLAPPQCPLFGKACTPAKPVGPCMVSTEGSCAAYFKYAMLA